MSRRGPKATPTALFAIEGGRSKKPRDKEPVVTDSRLPPRPDWIDDYAKAEWAFIVPHLHRIGVLKIIDRAVVAAYCVAFGRWRLAEEKVKQITDPKDAFGGLLIKTQSGNIIQNPLVGVANAARRDMVRCAAELGLSPSSRAQLQAEGGEEDDISRAYGI